MASETISQDQKLTEITTKVVKRWGVECPQESENQKKVIVTALKQAISVATKTAYKSVYPNDHSWSATGLRPLTVERLKHDDRQTLLEKAGEEWGVFALAEGFGNAIIIPIATDLSEETAEFVSKIVEEQKTAFLDLDELPFLFSKFAKGMNPEEEEISITIACGLWENVRDLALQSNLALSEAVFFRKPVAWDLTRARLSGAGFPELHPFSESEFQSRKNRSVKFNRKWASSTKKLLAKSALKDVNLNTPEGRNWFHFVVNGLNSLGLGKPMEGLSLVIHFKSFDKVHGDNGQRNLCVAYGLDPVQASYLLELCAEDPSSFHDLDLADGKYFQYLGLSVIPDMHLSCFNAVSIGRDAEAYDRLVEASKPNREFLNV